MTGFEGSTPRRIALGNNPGRNRTHNRRVVLDVIRAHGPLGRTRIARLAQLTPQAVANIVDELAADRLLVEVGRLRRNGRGQPPLQFAINPDGPMTAGVEIAADHMVTVLLDLAGTVRSSSIVPLRRTDPETVTARLPGEIAAARSRVAGRKVELLGVGVVMPGPFDIDGMTSVGPTTLPGWGGVDASAVIGVAIDETVTVENDATAAAVGERLYGAGRELNNFLMIYFGAGLGLGIVNEGLPLRGAFGNAGEIGHAVVVPHGRPCPCGQEGCLERYASLQALRETLSQAGIAADTPADIEALHQAGHPVLRGWIAEAAGHLRPMIATLENVLDPETIIIGGALSDAVIDDLIAALTPLPRSVATRRQRALPRLMRGQTGQLTAALGAAALPLLETITPKLDIAAEPEAAPVATTL
ncbi:MAG TPA: ROK family protein [Devosiaceae bacterium]|jgi:predicted NBD/HSP70 family sugar kinase